MADQSSGAERVARNQLLFRTVNAKIEDVNEAFALVTDTHVVICECADTHCVEQVELTASEYRAVREEPCQFIVAAGHVYPEYEHVVRSHPGYEVVEKTGRAGEIARSS